MAPHVLYGIKNSSIRETAATLGVMLQCFFQERESDYLGAYMLGRVSSAEIRIVSQRDPEGDPLEEDFEDYGTLVYVDDGGVFLELDGAKVGSESLTKLRS